MGALRVLLSVRSVSCLQQRAGRQSATQICGQTGGPRGVLGYTFIAVTQVVSGVTRPAAAGERGGSQQDLSVYLLFWM